MKTNNASIVSIIESGKTETGDINIKSTDKGSFPAYNNIKSTIDIKDKEVSKMDNNDWAKQYIESVDRSLSDIRKESNENRREIKNDILHYIESVNKKVDDSLNESRLIRQDIADRFTILEKKFDKLEDAVDKSKKHVDTIGVAVIVGLVATVLGIGGLILTLIDKLG